MTNPQAVTVELKLPMKDKMWRFAVTPCSAVIGAYFLDGPPRRLTARAVGKLIPTRYTVYPRPDGWRVYAPGMKNNATTRRMETALHLVDLVALFQKREVSRG